jgi:hypothetical protein
VQENIIKIKKKKTTKNTCKLGLVQKKNNNKGVRGGWGDEIVRNYLEIKCQQHVCVLFEF